MHSILLGSLVVFYTNLTRSRSLHSLFHFLPLDGVIYLAEKITYSACGLCGPFELNLLCTPPLYPSLSVLLSISFSILFWRFAVTTVAACSTHPFPRPSSAWLLLTETVRTVCWIRESSQLKLTAKLKSENEFVISFTATFAHFTVSWYSCHWGFWVNAFTRIPFFVGFP